VNASPIQRSAGWNPSSSEAILAWGSARRCIIVVSDQAQPGITEVGSKSRDMSEKDKQKRFFHAGYGRMWNKHLETDFHGRGQGMYLHEDQVELAEMQLCALQGRLVARVPHDDIYNVCFDEFALIRGKHLPPESKWSSEMLRHAEKERWISLSPVLDTVFERGQCKELALLALGLLQNCVYSRPALGMLLESRHEGIDLLPLRLIPRCVHGIDHLILFRWQHEPSALPFFIHNTWIQWSTLFAICLWNFWDMGSWVVCERVDREIRLVCGKNVTLNIFFSITKRMHVILRNPN
jgi:hypothetical protein